MYNNNGQVLLTTLLVANLLMGMLIFSAGFIKWIQVKNHSETVCRKHYLKAQSYVVKYAQKIKKLNPTATKLRIRLGILYAKLALLKDPINISATLWEIKQVKTKQNLLHAKQKGYIELARYKINLQTIKLNEKLSKKYKTIKVLDVPFKLTAKPPNARAPTYHLPSDFYKSQTVTATWTWLDTYYFQSVFTFSCSVGVKKKGLKWQPSLKKDSPLLNYL